MKLQDHLYCTNLNKWIITAKKQLFYKTKIIDAEETTNGNNVDSQEPKRQLTPNENMSDDCQFTTQSLMECYEIVGGLKR